MIDAFVFSINDVQCSVNSSLAKRKFFRYLADGGTGLPAGIDFSC